MPNSVTTTATIVNEYMNGLNKKAMDKCFSSDEEDLTEDDEEFEAEKVANKRTCSRSPVERRVISPTKDFCRQIKADSRVMFHPVGTVPMCSKELGGVVDPELKVYGTNNLRVGASMSYAHCEPQTHLFAE